MKKLFLLATTTAALLLISTHVYAANGLKVGVVDMNVVLQKSELMASLNSDLLKQFKPRQDELIAAQKSLQDETNQLNLNAVNMTPDDRSKLQDKVVSDQANVQILSASLQRDLAIAKGAAMQKFSAKVTDVIKQLASSGKFDLIEQTSNFLFIKPDLDVTQQVLAEVK